MPATEIDISRAPSCRNSSEDAGSRGSLPQTGKKTGTGGQTEDPNIPQPERVRRNGQLLDRDTKKEKGSDGGYGP